MQGEPPITLFKYSTNFFFLKALYEGIDKTTKSNMHENQSYQYTKIDTYENKWIHSSKTVSKSCSGHDII